MEFQEYSARVEKSPKFKKPELAFVDEETAQIFCPTSGKYLSFMLEFSDSKRFDDYLSSPRTGNYADKYGGRMIIMPPYNLVKDSETTQNNSKTQYISIDKAPQIFGVTRDEILAAQKVAFEAIVANFKSRRYRHKK